MCVCVFVHARMGVYVCECVSYKNVIILITVRCLVSYSIGDTSLVELSSPLPLA